LAVQRYWFAHAPDGIIGAADRARQGIGYGGISLATVVTVTLGVEYQTLSRSTDFQVLDRDTEFVILDRND
jgi:hypothetical protein